MSSPISSFTSPFRPKTPAVLGALVLGSLVTLAAAPEPPRPQFRWPVESETPPQIRGLTSTFGESRGDHFHNGLDIAAVNRPVRAIAGGRLLFTRLAGDTPFEQPPGPGNVVIVEHENGWRSGYYHLQRVAYRGPDALQPEGHIGVVGNTGRSRGIHLHFFVADPQGRYVNPLLVLPTAADEHPPEIGMAAVFAGDSMALLSPVQEENIRLSQAFPVGVTVIDPGLESGTRRGIYEISWQLNDGPVNKRRFDGMVFHADSLRLSSGEPFTDVFRAGRYLLGTLDFKDGSNTLKVTASDLAGNSSSRTYQVNVNRRR